MTRAEVFDAGAPRAWLGELLTTHFTDRVTGPRIPVALPQLVGNHRAMTLSVSSEAIDCVLELERELQTAACRADEARLRDLLAPDFVEIGASGRRWDLENMLSMLRDESAGSDDAVIEVEGLTARLLAPGIVQVFWDSHWAGRRARRTSVWCERKGRWQQVYHQGTPLP